MAEGEAEQTKHAEASKENQVEVEEQQDAQERSTFCGRRFYNDNNEARGYALACTARGPIIMSNILLSISLLYLAAEDAGCLDEEEEVISDCPNKVYGFEPSSLIANIMLISSVLSGVLMPVIGAILDYTPHRRLTGLITAYGIIAIQVIQIGISSKTWFPMLLLQGVAGFVYHAQVLATYAYLPDMGRLVGEKVMTTFVSRFQVSFFAAELSFGVVCIAISTALGFGSVDQGRLSQFLVSIVLFCFFFEGYKDLPPAPRQHQLPEGQSLLSAGFLQVWRTAKAIHIHYRDSLQWFLIATAFAEAGTETIVSLSVVYLSEQLEMSGTEVGAVILLSMFFCIFGAMFGRKVSHVTNPNSSLKFSLLAIAASTAAASMVLKGPESANLAYIFSFLWGFTLGWYNAAVTIFFSLCLPKGQEAELSGFFVYSTQILVWLPPLIFTVLNENGLSFRWTFLMLVCYLLVAVVVLCFVMPWNEVLSHAARTSVVHLAFHYDEQDILGQYKSSELPLDSVVSKEIEL